MHLLPDGDIRACCRNEIPLGNITQQRLPVIWAGQRRSTMVAEIAGREVPSGCEDCVAEIRTEGRRGSYPEVFDFWLDRLDHGPTDWSWPSRMEFNLSNRCNLQCIQCSGDLSSAIRIHREGRPALPSVYGDTFFDDLRAFLPHLRHANFAGGEPFLGPENFRVWELIAEIAPDLDCTINTNATQWNHRVEEVLDRGRFSFIFSLDGIHKDTYESIRIDADLDQVLTNIERFREHAARHGTDVNINHCLMPQNHHEFGDLLLYAEERGIKVNCSVVRSPRECSIAYLDRSDIAAIHRTLRAQERALLPRLRLNASTWTAEVERIAVWAEQGPPETPSDHTQPEPQPVAVEIVPRTVIPPTPPQPPPATILGMARQGGGPTDVRTAIEELRSFSADGAVHVVTVGADETITSCSSGLLDLLAAQHSELEGRSLDALAEVTERRFGAVVDHRLDPVGPDRIDGSTLFDRAEARSAMVALRDDDGWADSATILIALRPR